MGTCGTAIFADDVAADVRDHWRRLVADGLAPDQATGRLESAWSDSLQDPDEEPVFWLALAAAQWETGRLLDRVRSAALEIIDTGGDLERWEEPADRRRRTKVLENLRAKLVGPQRRPVKLRRPHVQTTMFEPGDVFSYRRADGKIALFRVSGIESSGTRDRSPFVELLDFDGDEPPDKRELARLPGRIDPRAPKGSRDQSTLGYILLDRPRHPEPRDRIEILAKGLPPKPSYPYHRPQQVYIEWSDLDAELDRVLRPPSPES